jgi:hypothetical protein
MKEMKSNERRQRHNQRQTNQMGDKNCTTTKH